MWPWKRYRPHPVKPVFSKEAQPAAQDKKTVEQITQSLWNRYQVKDLLTQATTLGKRLENVITELKSGSLEEFQGDIDVAEEHIQHATGKAPDIILRRLVIGQKLAWPCLIAFVDGLSSNEMIDQDTIGLLQSTELDETIAPNGSAIQVAAEKTLVSVGHVSKESRWSKIMTSMLSGSTVVLIEGASEALILDTVKYPARSIPTDTSEPSIKGPQEAFNEVGLTHLNQLRRWIRSPDLHFNLFTIGTRSHTPVYLTHIRGVTNPALVSAITDRLQRITRDQINRSNEVAEYLYERHFSLFPQVRFSDRVDWVAHELSRGKLAILVDNDPFAIILPTTLFDYYKTSQDYSFSFWDASLVRLIRLVGLLAGLYLMPLYIALTSINVDLIPTQLLLTIAGSRQGIPFPPIVEVIIMYGIIEILREAANRLPKELAVTLGTVGAVVVGTAIVKAGIVDDIMIVIATLTALGLFVTPAYELTTAWRWLFWVMILGSYFYGIFGILLVTVAIIGYMAGLESFGVPYLTPFGPLRVKDLADAWIRLPLSKLILRPSSARPVDIQQAEKMTVEDPLHLRHSQVERTRFKP